MRKNNRLFTYLTLIIVGLLFLGSVPAFAKDKSSLEKARERLEEKLAGMPGFAGIAHSEEEGEIIVFLENEKAKGNVPDSHEGFPVRKQVTGKFKALGVQLVEATAPSETNLVSSERLGTIRPLVGGISVSAYIPGVAFAGTLSMVTYGEKKILSNAHVLAYHPETNKPLALGTPTIQQGSLDGGTVDSNKVGELYKYITINFNSFWRPNYADAAIAKLDLNVEGLSGVQFAEGGNYTVSGFTLVNKGDTVRKSGRTTGVTANKVTSNNASLFIWYGNKWAYFKDQILVNQPFLQAGDSGSLVDKNGQFVGLAFAGSDTIAVVCKAINVMAGLGISVR